MLGVVGAAGASVCGLLPAGAQQAKPVIGYLGATSRGKDTHTLAAFHQGLKELGFAEGQTSRLNTAMRMANTINSPRWPPIWCSNG
jgi:hypothetical protein